MIKKLFRKIRLWYKDLFMWPDKMGTAEDWAKIYYDREDI